MSFSSLRQFLGGVLKTKVLLLFLSALVFISFLFPPDTLANLKILLGTFSLFLLPGNLILSVAASKYKEKSLLEIVVYSLIIGMSVSLLLLFALGSFNLQIPDWVIVLIFLIIDAIAIFKIIKESVLKKKFVQVLKEKEYILLLIVLSVLLFISFQPIKGLLVAPLHDPAQNAIASSKLIVNDFQYDAIPLYASHYPPGASYIIALLGNFAGISGAKMTLVLTTLMAIFAGFALKIFTEKYSTNKKLSNIALVFVSLAFPYILGLYVMAGKNSQVFAYSFLLVSLALFYESLRGSIVMKVLTCLVVAASFLVHYSNIVVFSLFALLIFLIEIIKKHESLINIFRQVLQWLLPISVMVVFVVIQVMNINEVPAAGGLGSSQISAFGPFSIENFFRYLFNPPANVFARLNSIFMIGGPVAYVLVLAISLREFIEKKRIEKFKTIIIFMPVIYLVLYLIPNFKISYFSNLHVYLFIVILFSYGIYEFLNFHPEQKLKNLYKYLKYLFAAVGISYLIFSGYWLWKGNVEARELVTVQAEDLRAFEWIEENTDDSEYFLPSALQGFEIKQNYETDGLLYLKAFTGREDILSFVQGDIAFDDSIFRENYLRLAEDLGNTEVLNEFTASGVGYIYVDSEVNGGGSYINPLNFSDYPFLYKLIYNLEGIKIYEINE